jgi:hypothetical protein
MTTEVVTGTQWFANIKLRLLSQVYLPLVVCLVEDDG